MKFNTMVSRRRALRDDEPDSHSFDRPRFLSGAAFRRPTIDDSEGSTVFHSHVESRTTDGIQKLAVEAGDSARISLVMEFRAGLR